MVLLRRLRLEILKLRIQVEVFFELGDVQKTLFLNIDEVPVFLDLSPTRTYHPQGAKMVEVKRTKGGKMLFWVQDSSFRVTKSTRAR